jgi:hypothetical protein
MLSLISSAHADGVKDLRKFMIDERDSLEDGTPSLYTPG